MLKSWKVLLIVCLSVIASVIPKSKKRTLAPSLAPSIVLAIFPNPFLPPSVVQSNRKLSSDLLILNVPGTLPLHEPLLFDRLQVPELASLKDNVTGVLGSLTMVAHDVRIKTEIKIIAIFC